MSHSKARVDSSVLRTGDDSQGRPHKESNCTAADPQQRRPCSTAMPNTRYVSGLLAVSFRQCRIGSHPVCTLASNLNLHPTYRYICRRARSDSATGRGGGARVGRPRATVRGGDGSGGGAGGGGWMDDDDSPSCLLCDALFTFTKRWGRPFIGQVSHSSSGTQAMPA